MTGHIYDGVGPSHVSRLTSSICKTNEDLISIKYQTPLKSKYDLFCLTETRVVWYENLV